VERVQDHALEQVPERHVVIFGEPLEHLEEPLFDLDAGLHALDFEARADVLPGLRHGADYICTYVPMSRNQRARSVLEIGMGFLREAWKLAKCTVQSWIDDTAPSMGAAVAFYALFSLAPLLLVAVAVAGFFLGEDVAQGMVLDQIRQFVGPSAALGIESLL